MISAFPSRSKYSDCSSSSDEAHPKSNTGGLNFDVQTRSRYSESESEDERTMAPSSLSTKSPLKASKYSESSSDMEGRKQVDSLQIVNSSMSVKHRREKLTGVDSRSQNVSHSRKMRSRYSISSDSDVDNASKNHANKNSSSSKLMTKAVKHSKYSESEDDIASPTFDPTLRTNLFQLKKSTENSVRLESCVIPSAHDALPSPQPKPREVSKATQRLYQMMTSKNEMDPLETQRRAKALLAVDTITFCCCICCESFYKSADYARCRPFHTGSVQEFEHTVCKNCVRMYSTPDMVNLASDGSGIRCPTGGDCPNVLLLSHVHSLLDAGVLNILYETIGRFSIAAAKIEGLIRCPECQVPVISSPCHKSYECPGCKRMNCTKCEALYDQWHKDRTCDQAKKAKSDDTEALTNMIMHRCHRCGLQFIKDQGCNKITCKCGATQCYVCRAKDIGYEHFRHDNICGRAGNYHEVEVNQVDAARRQRGFLS